MALVLVVDDDSLSLQLLEFILKRERHSVVTTVNSAETIRLVQRYHPDLVILNDMMPFVSGGELCKRIKADPALAATPIVLISAGVRVRDPDYVRESHADAVLLKPCVPADVHRILTRYAQR